MAAPTEPEIENQDSGGEEELHGQMSFFDHLEELRTRLLNIVIVVAVAFVVCWTYRVGLFAFVKAPIDDLGRILIGVGPTEGFNVSMKVSFTAAIFIAAPFIMREVWLFISPALYRKERRYAIPFLVASSLLFVTGGAFGYYIAFPFAVQFLIAFTVEIGIEPYISAAEYFDLFLVFELLMGVVFEIPAVIFVLSRIGLVSGPFLLKNFPYAMLISVILAALLTPTTDIPNLMMITIPMVILYSVGILVAYIFGKKKKE